MAKMSLSRKDKKAIGKERKFLERKKRICGDDWEQADGAGMMPEVEWKKYSPESKTTKEYKKGVSK